jgi:hypothetical protein
MAVSHRDAAFAQFVEHGGVVDAQVIADPRQGPAKVVEVDGVVDLLGREARRRMGTPCRCRMLLTVRRSMPNRSPSASACALVRTSRRMCCAPGCWLAKPARSDRHAPMTSRSGNPLRLVKTPNRRTSRDRLASRRSKAILSRTDLSMREACGSGCCAVDHGD